MADWKTYLNGDPTSWLLEKDDPSIRYFTLQWVEGRDLEDPEVEQASQVIANSEPVRKILRKQKPEGYWGSDSRPHHGTRGVLGLLMWLGYRGNGEVRKAIDYRIEGCLQDDGAYGIEMKGRLILLPCHGAGLLLQMLRNGYSDDPRTRSLLDWMLGIQENDGAWPCISKLRPFNCSWATADVLRAFHDLPSEWITPRVAKSRDMAIEMFLEANIYQYGKGKPSPRWLEFGFPLQWDSDILEVLNLIAPFVSPDDHRVQEGLDLVLEKQDESGRWPCEKHPKGGRWMQKFFPFEEMGQPSKWVTLHAVKMLKTLYT